MTEKLEGSKVARAVEKGMILLCREDFPEKAGIPPKYQLWSVTGAHKVRKGTKVSLSGYAPGVLMSATATFPENGEIRAPWVLFDLSRRDLEHVHKALAALSSEDATRPTVEASCTCSPGVVSMECPWHD